MTYEHLKSALDTADALMSILNMQANQKLDIEGAVEKLKRIIRERNGLLYDVARISKERDEARAKLKAATDMVNYRVLASPGPWGTANDAPRSLARDLVAEFESGAHKAVFHRLKELLAS